MAENHLPDVPNSQKFTCKDYTTAQNSSHIEKDANGNFTWKRKTMEKPVLSLADISVPPPTNSAGDRYILISLDNTVPDSGWGEDAAENQIIELFDTDLDSSADTWAGVFPEYGTTVFDKATRSLLTFATRADSSADYEQWVCPEKVYYCDASTQGTDAGTDEKTLASVDIPSAVLNSLYTNDYIQIECTALFTDTANAKTLRIKVGGLTHVVETRTDLERFVKIIAKLYKLGMESQTLEIETRCSTSSGTVDDTDMNGVVYDLTEDFRDTLTIELTGQNNIAAANDIIKRVFKVKLCKQ